MQFLFIRKIPHKNCWNRQQRQREIPKMWDRKQRMPSYVIFCRIVVGWTIDCPTETKQKFVTSQNFDGATKYFWGRTNFFGENFAMLKKNCNIDWVDLIGNRSMFFGVILCGFPIPHAHKTCFNTSKENFPMNNYQHVHASCLVRKMKKSPSWEYISLLWNF